MKQYRRSVVGVLAVGLLALTSVYAQSSQGSAEKKRAGEHSNSANRMGSADQTFVTKAAQGGLAQVQLGTLATQKAANADVKAFGQQMVDDHSKANDELKQLASSKGITLPTDVDAKQ